MNIALNTTQRILTIVIILALSIAGITPAHAAETQNTFHQKRTQFGFTMSIPDPDNPEQAYRDLDKMKELGVKWVRTGIITSDMVTRWGDGGKVEVNQETIDLYVDFLKKAKSYNMKVILMSVEGYYGDITYNQYLTEMRQYWNLISEPLSPYADVWQVYNEPDGLHYRTYEPVNQLPDEAAYYKELANSISEFRTIVKQDNSQTRVTTNLSGYPMNDKIESDWNYRLDIIHRSLDLITVDVYPEYNLEEIKEVPERLSRIKNKYKKNVMIGEIGMPTCTTCSPKEQVAQALTAFIDYLPHKDTEAIIFYQLRDSSNDNTGESSFGIYNHNETDKEYVQDATEQGLQTYYAHPSTKGKIEDYYTAYYEKTGAPLRDQITLSNPHGSYQLFENGTVYDSSAGTWLVGGEIMNTYSNFSYEKGRLGFPRTDETAFINKPDARYQEFQGGLITWDSHIGAYVLSGAIGNKWKVAGWERSQTQLPTSNERRLKKENGTYQKFQSGSIHWSPKTGAHITQAGSPIQKKWGSLKYENGYLGYPSSDQVAFKYDESADYQNFQGGMVITHSRTGTHTLKGAIQNKWKSMGWERSAAGLPVSDERKLRKGAYQKFEDGQIHWSSKTGTHYTKDGSAIQRAWSKQGWENGRLGYPTSDEYKSGGKTWQNFEGGKISWTSKEGSKVHYSR